MWKMAPFSLSVLVATVVNINTARSGCFEPPVCRQVGYDSCVGPDSVAYQDLCPVTCGESPTCREVGPDPCVGPHEVSYRDLCPATCGECSGADRSEHHGHDDEDDDHLHLELSAGDVCCIQSGHGLWSPNHDYWLDFKDDGNLFLYQHDHEHDDDDEEHHENDTRVWYTTTWTESTPPYSLEMQMDNNLVVYDSKRKVTWNSRTYGKGARGGKTVLQDDGLVIYDKDGVEIWRKS